MTAARGRPAVFLDRDGVLTEAFVRDGGPRPPRTLAEFRVLPGVAQACSGLRRAGFVLVVVTNQPDIARGTQARAVVEEMNERLRSLVPLDEVCMCPHDDADGCACRKPRPGMLLDAAERLGLDLARSACVGDRWRDVEAALAAGVTAIYVDRHYGEQPPAGAHAVVADLPEAAAWIREQDWAPKSGGGRGARGREKQSAGVGAARGRAQRGGGRGARGAGQAGRGGGTSKGGWDD